MLKEQEEINDGRIDRATGITGGRAAEIAPATGFAIAQRTAQQIFCDLI
jgi:hypothetical protein